MSRRFVAAIVCLCLALSPLHGQDKIEITVEGGKHDLKNVPICVPLSVAKERQIIELNGKGTPLKLICRLTAPGIVTESIPPADKGLVRRDLHFIVPDLKAGQKLTLTLGQGTFDPTLLPHFVGFGPEANIPNVVGFAKPPNPNVPPILEYMRAAYDNSTPEKRNRTYKVFHHLWAPAGYPLVTNGGHTDRYDDEKTLLYPHHRGLMFAFNKISYGEGLKRTADTWHATPGDTHQAHVKFLRDEDGVVLGRHRVLISWHGAKNDVFATEERELTAYAVPGGTLVDFASKLKTTGGKVRLDGDPQHAGFQFRAANEVAGKESAKQTYFLRPDGKGALGATRNWDPKTKEGPVNLPWDAMSFVLGGKRYTVAYLNSPQNPKESRFSERDYGRFGCYFEYDLTEEHPLVANYRVWLQDGEMTGEQVEALYQAFAHPPQVTVKK